MKGCCLYLFLLMVAFALGSVFGQDKREVTVLLDPGHGGNDTGAVGVNGVAEKDIVIDITKEVMRLNRELYNDTLAIYLTRYTDTLISLGHRTKLAKLLKVDLFVSIHCNQAERKSAQGVEVFLYRDDGPSYGLAQKLAIGLNQRLGFKNRGLKTANFQVLRETEGLCPSVLLELGFLSNWEEALHNSKGTSITAYALLILETLTSYPYD